MSDDQKPAATRAVEGYLKLRDKRAALKKKYETLDKEFKDKMEAIELWLQKRMDEAGTSQLKPPGAGATAYVQVENKFGCGDWENFYAFCIENNRLDFLHKRLSSGEIKTYLEETGELPPGVNVATERKVIVRKG